MQVTRGYRTELDPTQEQRLLFHKCAGVARFSYNYALVRKQEAYQRGERIPTAIDLQKELTVRKHTDLPWLAEVSKWVVQNALRNADTAYENFFEHVRLKKQGKWKGKGGYPRFKAKKRGRGSFRLDDPVYVFEDAIQLPRIGRVRLKEHDYIPTWGVKVLSATVSEEATGRWYVSVQVQYEIRDPVAATGPAIGVDLGIKTLAVCSDGRTFENPKALRSRLKALKRASRRHSRKEKGSRNREKSRKKLAKLHARIRHIRQDALHKATSALVAKTTSRVAIEERPRVIVLEDLHVQGMLQNRKLSRAIADVGFFEFRRQIQYKAAFAGVQVYEVSRWEPTSKRCSQCGAVREELGLAERMFVCYTCGYTLDRDLNAARNLAALAPRRI